MAEKMDANLDYNARSEEVVIDANRKMRVGIIGCGWIADSHMICYKAMPDVEIVAGADLIPGKAAAFMKKHGIENVKTSAFFLQDMLTGERLFYLCFGIFNLLMKFGKLSFKCFLSIG